MADVLRAVVVSIAIGNILLMAWQMVNPSNQQYSVATRWGLMTQCLFCFAAAFSILARVGQPLSWVLPVNATAIIFSLITALKVRKIPPNERP